MGTMTIFNGNSPLMKLIVAALLLFPLCCPAQDCKLTKTTDDFTHEIRLSTGFIPFNTISDRILLSIDANNAEVDFFFSLNGAGDTKCFDNASTATILFDGTKLKANFKNNGTMNCEGLFHINFRNLAATPYALQRLATQKISSIRLIGNNKAETNIILKEEQKDLLMNMAACVVKEAKTLLK
jgi:hypothetical protein